MKLKGFPDYRVEVDRTTRAEWSDLMVLFDDATIIQAWDFARAVCPEQHVSRLILYRRGEVAGLAQVRILSLPFLKRGVAHVEWGPIWRRHEEASDPRNFAALLTALREEYALRRRLLLRVVPKITGDSGMEPENICVQTGYLRNVNVKENRTIIKDISAPLAEIRMTLEKNWRRCLGRAESNCLEIRHGVSTQYFKEFLPVYNMLMMRKGLSPSIDLDRWIRLQEILPDSEKPHIFMVRNRGEAIAGLVVSSMGNTGFPIAAASSSDGLKMLASYLMHWHAIEWLKEEGCSFYDLAGIDPEKNPGTYHFKKGFRGQEVSFIGQFEQCLDPLSKMVVRVGEPLRELSRRLPVKRGKETATVD